MDGAPACPFVAFGDDREARSTSPDHRHRCFAETPPAPRAVAHQEAYCLSSAFPVCPTFQDWARREAAHARAAGDRPPAAPPPRRDARTAPRRPVRGLGDPATARRRQPTRARTTDRTTSPIQRNPPRDWAAPPPWATGAAIAGGLSARPGVPATPPASPTAPAPTEPPPSRPVEGQGLAGSPADRLAAGEVPAALAWSASAGGHAATAPDEELAGLVQGRAPSNPGTPAQARQPRPSVPAAALAAAAVAASASAPRTPSPSFARPEAIRRRRARASGPPSARRRDVDRRARPGNGCSTYEAYPAIKSGSSMRGLPRRRALRGRARRSRRSSCSCCRRSSASVAAGARRAPSPSASRPSSTRSAAPTVVAGPDAASSTSSRRATRCPRSPTSSTSSSRTCSPRTPTSRTRTRSRSARRSSSRRASAGAAGGVREAVGLDRPVAGARARRASAARC